MAPLIQVQDLTKVYSLAGSRRIVHAVNGVSFSVERGETLGLVGESGCGKSTVGRSLARLIEPTSGRILYNDRDLAALDKATFRSIRPKIQMVFQDPYDSFDPHMTVQRSLEEPLRLLRISSKERPPRIIDLLHNVTLDQTLLDRFPHQLAGGQLQRIGIARALAMEPELLILDEPTSSLDLSVRSGILSLLQGLQRQHG